MYFVFCVISVQTRAIENYTFYKIYGAKVQGTGPETFHICKRCFEMQSNLPEPLTEIDEGIIFSGSTPPFSTAVKRVFKIS